MSDGDGKEEFFVTCPKCKRKVKVKDKEAEETMKVRCSCGETIVLMKGLGT
jgi:DNA-directed RNA polymerase subunit RPC12/RpoP